MIKIKFELRINVYHEKASDVHITNSKENPSFEEKGSACIEDKAADTDFMAFAEQEVRRAAANGHFSTSRNYQTALRSLTTFAGSAKLSVSQIDGTLMERYQRWLVCNGICPNTISCYMRSLRTLYNRTVSEMGINSVNPFDKVFTGHTETVKRSIPATDIRKIINADLKGKKSLEQARDIFLFCYCALGMPFVDVAFLRKTNIKNGFITYCRHKTGQQIRIKVEPCMKRIIKKYETTDSNYVFPIISTEQEDTAHHQYLVALGRYNRNLKKITKLAKISTALTSYVVRHSWASNAFEQNVDLPVISKALGHRDTKTTLTYIRGINDNRLDEANRKLLRSIQSKKKTEG